MDAWKASIEVHLSDSSVLIGPAADLLLVNVQDVAQLQHVPPTRSCNSVCFFAYVYWDSSNRFQAKKVIDPKSSSDAIKGWDDEDRNGDRSIAAVTDGADQRATWVGQSFGDCWCPTCLRGIRNCNLLVHLQSKICLQKGTQWGRQHKFQLVQGNRPADGHGASTALQEREKTPVPARRNWRMKIHLPKIIWACFLFQEGRPRLKKVARRVFSNLSGDAPNRPCSPSIRTPSSTASFEFKTSLSGAVSTPASTPAPTAALWSSRALLGVLSALTSADMKLSRYTCHQQREGLVLEDTWVNQAGGPLPLCSSSSGDNPWESRSSRLSICIRPTEELHPMGSTRQQGLTKPLPGSPTFSRVVR